jgi:hypothetical protein
MEWIQPLAALVLKAQFQQQHHQQLLQPHK